MSERIDGSSGDVVTHGQALGRVVAGDGELDGDGERRPLGWGEELIFERQQSGDRMIEAA